MEISIFQKSIGSNTFPMVCKTYDIPCVELRCISNMVEDRNTADWKLEEAIAKICMAVEVLLNEYGPLGAW